ncbi:MAG TPA: DUF2330 domain-containing protein, partial [Candidatus Dormibacteraeota bacterium]|nr:DUF2330 domain-containing protein [Candidatus Dormibacteraeota bacterium]
MHRKLLAAAALAGGLAVLGAVPAAACGGLVAPNGAVRLARATTFVAWQGGVEHYMTSFGYQGDVPGLGWIVPLPAVPDRVEKGGGWTLQRLQRETHPAVADSLAFKEGLAAAAAPAEVLQQLQIDALDITVLKGSGQAVVDWCRQNGFTLPDETRAHLLAYAVTSPIFMAAKYDIEAARQRGQFSGDGTPVLITMHTPHLWVPLEVLANALDPVVADLYLLTATRPAAPETLAPGFVLVSQQRMTTPLQRDLSSDRNMSWVPQQGWLSYLTLNAPSPQVTYDMSVTPDGGVRLASMGVGPVAGARAPALAPSPAPRWRTPL